MNAIETKHTPGPWIVRQLCGELGGVDPQIATMPDSDGFGKPIATVHYLSQSERQANAALIAQAPDLLAERDRLAAINAELVAALDSLIFAAECRDNTMGDQSRLIDVKASLVAATVLARSVSFEAKHARAALAKAQAE